MCLNSHIKKKETYNGMMLAQKHLGTLVAETKWVFNIVGCLHAGLEFQVKFFISLDNSKKKNSS